MCLSLHPRPVSTTSLNVSQGPRNLGTRRTVIVDDETVPPFSPRKCLGFFPRLRYPDSWLPDVRSEDGVECPITGDRNPTIVPVGSGWTREPGYRRDVKRPYLKGFPLRLVIKKTKCRE